jgi:hypothetical protein
MRKTLWEMGSMTRDAACGSTLALLMDEEGFVCSPQPCEFPEPEWRYGHEFDDLTPPWEWD